MIIPVEKLSTEVLQNLLESYITREGTDYGRLELSLEEKSRQLMEKVKAGEVLIVYDESLESFNLMSREEYAD